jgi:NhaP-type Na+/H+ or K+/H+ antiporter
VGSNPATPTERAGGRANVFAVLALVVIMALLLAWALVAGRLARWSITAPLAMMVAGVALTAGSSPVFLIDLDTSTFEHIAEVVLAILLFVDATEVPGSVLGPEPRLILRLLLIALPLTLVAAVGAGYLSLPGHGFWLLAVIATVVVPTDMAPAAALIRDRRIPRRLRDLLNVESGLNDGVVAPLFLVCLAATPLNASGTLPEDGILDAAPAIAIAIAAGAGVGYGGRWVIEWSWSRDWTQPASLRLGVAALPLMAYGLANAFGGNGFVSAFVAGVVFAPVTRRLPKDALNLAEDLSGLLSLAIWFVFGQLINQTMGHVSVGVVVYALLVLTVVRIGPVMLSLRGTGLRVADRAFVGWLGPRGLASIVFGSLAFIELSPADGDVVAEVMVATVLLSIVLHGLSFGPIGAHYGRRASVTGSDAPAND